MEAFSVILHLKEHLNFQLEPPQYVEILEKLYELFDNTRVKGLPRLRD